MSGAAVRVRRCLVLIPGMLLLTAATGSMLGASLASAHVLVHPDRPKVFARPADAGDGPTDYCQGCEPPLTYQGGPVMNTWGPSGVTVTPVYWAPPGTKFPPGYESLINGYIANVAAASGSDNNVYSVDTEYYEVVGGQPTHIRYRIAAGTPIVDTDRMPRAICKPSSRWYSSCIDDDQLADELYAVLAARHLPDGLAHFYPVFFPPRVQTFATGAGYAGSGYCAYHSDSGSGASLLVYSNEPFLDVAQRSSPTAACGSGQSPNDNPDADEAIDTLSHELQESITDPTISAWFDRAGYEMADECEEDYGQALGSTNPATPQTTEYNQLINGGHYYTQTVFSNYAYHRHGAGNGCQPSESAARGASATAGSSVTHLYFDMSRNTLPANGKASSTGFVQVWGNNNVDTPGDRIFFTTYPQSGSGHCGTLKPRTATTDGAGSVSPVYRASRANIACVIVATDAEGGRSASLIVYQGKARSKAPKARATFPRLVTAGRTMTFTERFTNPKRKRIADTQIDFWIFVPFYNSPNVTHRQVHLWVSWHGRRGPFVPLKLTGSTSNTAGISSVIGGPTGFAFKARRTLTLTFRIRVSKSVPLNRPRPILQFQTFLDQVDPASGADSVFATTPAVNARVR
jgi:hypothetical protein